MPAALLRTKLYIPPAPLKLVPRPRLTELLNKGTSPPSHLALLSAPAGFGKTTLLSEWIHQTKQLVAWISLDEGDNDPARFFAYIIAALQTIQADIGQSTATLLQSPQLPPLDSILTTLVNEIASVSHHLVLVFDDFHVIEAAPIQAALAFLLDHLPPQVYLVIATRSDPGFPLGRLRARGQLTEIRAGDLRLTFDESALFLNQVMNLNLQAEDIAALEARTEGWVAGLQLAALSIRGHEDVRQFVQSFTSSHRHIMDYLIEEVFQHQSADVQDLLLKTSILDRFTASLCDAVVGRHDSRRLLQTLEQANLFVIPLDVQHQWFRYHHLLAELLRHRLETVQAQDAKPLHERASAWYEANGFTADALNHALAANDWARAAALIGRANETMLKSGEVITLVNWLRAFPDETLRADPRLCLAYSWALILTGQPLVAESYLKQAEAISQNVIPILGNIYAAQAYIARARGDDRRTIEISERALSFMPKEPFGERSVVGVNLGIAYLNAGRVPEAEQVLTETERTAQQSDNHHVRLIALALLGNVQVIHGRLHRGEEFFQQAIRLGRESPAVALAHIQYSALLCEWNELDAAADHLQRGLELGERVGNVEVQIGGYRTLAHLKQARGEASAARDVIEKAHQFARDHHLPPIMGAAIAASHVEIALAQNDLPTAVRWADQVAQAGAASPFYPLLGLTRARVLLAQKQSRAAADELAKRYVSVSRAGWGHAQIATRVLQALAAETSQARLEFLTEALIRAQPEGFIRVFADAGKSLLPLLQDVALQGTLPEYVGKIIAAIKLEPSSPLQSSLSEPVSEREIEVLRLVAAGLSNREIAKKLIITPGTAKTHIHNVCGKLGVRNRTEAAMRAKELGLV